MTALSEWVNRCPGDFSAELPVVFRTDPEPVIARAAEAFVGWSRMPLDERIELAEAAKERIEAVREELAVLIATEVGKPLREARLEVGAVVAKFALTIEDARRFVAPVAVTDGPHPAFVRRRPHGVAAVVSPFNFPIHLGHGAALAYLLAGNTVVLKPSPWGANVAARYGQIMAEAFPEGVFQVAQGWADVAVAVCGDPRVRAVCFTGSMPAGRAIAAAVAEDYSKVLALELGGMNSLVVCADADLEGAAQAAADGITLTAGQRCNATSRVLVEESVAAEFGALLRDKLSALEPGDPRDESTVLGPLISEVAVGRFAELIKSPLAETWLVSGRVVGEVGGLRGNYVTPAVMVTRHDNPFGAREAFAPVAAVTSFANDADAVRMANAPQFGLSASIFTADEARFTAIGDELRVGNLYRNLPTTFSPSTLPFGGFGASGNGRPGGRGFIRFAGDEQAVQWR